MYSPRDIIEILAANVRNTMSPFGVPKALVNGWWKGADIGREGDELLFTGLMYQFVPFIEAATRQLARFEDTEWAGRIGLAKNVPSLLSGLGLAALAPAEGKRRAAQRLRDIATVLKKSGASVGYRPELDEYSGVLLYDLGDQEGFERHARIVADRLKQAGIRRIVTTDPHTTYALKVLYPKHVGAEFEVRPYFEGLHLDGQGLGGAITLHDPCFYGRYLKLSDHPRRVLTKMGYNCVDLRESGTFTSCCGGPAESISPKLSHEIGAGRAQKLSAADGRIVTMCPLCLNNLEKCGADVVDLSAVLAHGLTPPHGQ